MRQNELDIFLDHIRIKEPDGSLSPLSTSQKKRIGCFIKWAEKRKKSGKSFLLVKRTKEELKK